MNNLCQFEHDNRETEETSSDDKTETDDELTEDEVECQMCGCTFVDETELQWHVRANHSDSTNPV